MEMAAEILSCIQYNNYHFYSPKRMKVFLSLEGEKSHYSHIPKKIIHL